jgi:hypothetical protein
MENKRKLQVIRKKLMKKFSKQKSGEQAEAEALETFFKPVTGSLKPQAVSPTILTITPPSTTPPVKKLQSPKTEEPTTPIYQYEETNLVEEIPSEDAPTTPTLEYVGMSRGDRYTPTTSALPRRISTPPTLPSVGSLRTLSTLLPNEVLGQTASAQLKKYFDQSQAPDPIFGMRYNFDRKEMEMGDKTVKIFENDVVMAGKQHPGRRQLWNLLLFKDLYDTTHSPDVLASYASILKDSNSIYQNNDPQSGKPKSSRGAKYTKIIKPIWEDIKASKTGKGLIKNQIPAVEYKYYQDPNELVDRLRLLYGSIMAGSDVHRNEVVEILSELETRGILTQRQTVNAHYKIFGI